MLTQTLTPAIYRTTISHCRQVPVHHSFAYRSYSWYVDVDNLPQLPWWLRPFARFHADDHFADPFSCPPHSSLRDRLDATLAALPSPTAVSPRCCKHAFSAMSSTR